MNSFPEILTDRLLLRHFVVADDEAVFKIFSNDRVTEFYDLDSFTNIEQARNFVTSRMCLNDEGGKHAFRWAICMKTEPNRVIGSCSYHSVNKRFSSIEIGYELHPDFWGKRIAFEAVDAMLKFCFNNDFPFPINRVSATTNLDSKRSIKLLNALGFKEEGILRQYGFWKNKFHDVRLFSILRSEWITQTSPS